MPKAIINAKIVHNNAILEDKVLLFDKSIIGIVDTLPSGFEVVDAEGNYLSAGFIDIHIHGSGGADVMDGTLEALNVISNTIVRTGTTSFVATTMTMSRRDIIDALDNIVKYKNIVSGAKIEGIHLEGPFINPSRAGAQNSSFIQEFNSDWIEPYLDDISIITIAPEMEGAEEFIGSIRESHPHIIFSIGHSDASYEMAQKSFEWGVSHATHLFNAMPSLHHREVGLVGAVLDSSITADIIADLIHTHPTMLRVVDKMKKGKMMLITDAMRAGCLCSGEYSLGGQQVTVLEGKATLGNGVIAGSVLKLNEAIRNYKKHTNSTIEDVISMVTTLPAQKLGLPIGELREGRDANIVIFDDDINIKQVYIDGKLKYNI